ncbi:cytochrome P460 family protein [Candidatus Amoebophilus asiaticus]|nr:cytochrome P460 family protein [Candidatus Amoebophilus asiaticus]
MRYRSIGMIVVCFLFVLLMNTCTKDKAEIKLKVTDEDLFALVTSAGYTYYQNSSDTLPTAQESAHDNYIRVRFNTAAQADLDTDGQLPENRTFRDSSVIVKEVYGSKGGNLTLYAVMMKFPGAEDAGEDWLWAEYGKDGSTIISLTDKGKACISCHSSAGNRDLVRLFELH